MYEFCDSCNSISSCFFRHLRNNTMPIMMIAMSKTPATADTAAITTFLLLESARKLVKWVLAWSYCHNQHHQQRSLQTIIQGEYQERQNTYEISITFQLPKYLGTRWSARDNGNINSTCVQAGCSKNWN